MRIRPFIWLLLIIVLGCNRPDKKITCDYDIIVVGGGLAGLSAAHELSTQKVLVLEKDSLLGGRVRTANFMGKYYYDLGAVFALDSVYRKEVLVEDNEIIEQEPIAIFNNGKLYFGKNPLACILQLPGIDSTKVLELYRQNKFNPHELDRYLYDALNIQIKAVFPGALKNYNQNISAFSWVRYNSSHFEHGNYGVVHFFLKDKKVDYTLNAPVEQVNDKGDFVEVVFSHKGNKDTLTAKKVVVATPSFVAEKIISVKNPTCEKFISGVQYAGYHSIAVGVKQVYKNPAVSYLMPLGTGFSSIVKNNTMDSLYTIFQLYIAEEDFPLFKDDADIKKKSIQILQNIWHIKETDIAFYDQFFWKHAGVVINEHYTHFWKEKSLQPSKNVFLAGDYALINSEVPYGMIPAMTSGKLVAQKILKTTP
ncbi:MAG: FAD-dependent oxidoreductase [Chitinophagales bacterium]|nr:FAD-dependent oxidoreductase [Chitinophagales bacterium]